MNLRLCLAGALTLASLSPAFPKDTGEWKDASPELRDWFKGVRAPSGIPCCDIADGHATDFDIRSDGYWIPTPGNPHVWMRVPDEAVVNNAGNPTGRAIVWTGHQFNGEISIRCFVAGAGG